jgi:hypothetical protein
MKEVCQQGTNSIRGKSDTVFFGLIEESNMHKIDRVENIESAMEVQAL